MFNVFHIKLFFLLLLTFISEKFVYYYNILFLPI